MHPVSSDHLQADLPCLNTRVLVKDEGLVPHRVLSGAKDGLQGQQADNKQTATQGSFSTWTTAKEGDDAGSCPSSRWRQVPGDPMLPCLEPRNPRSR